MEDSKISAFLELADDAYKQRDFKTLLTYANKLLDLDKMIPRVWFYTGAAIAWEEMIVKPKETINLLQKAWTNAFSVSQTPEMRENIAKLINFELDKIYKGVITTFMQGMVTQPEKAKDLYSPLVQQFQNSIITLPMMLTIGSIETAGVMKIDLPHITLEEWNNTYEEFYSSMSSTVRMGSRSEVFAQRLYHYVCGQIGIDFITGTALEVHDRLPAFQKSLQLLETSRNDLSRRFGNSFNDMLNPNIKTLQSSIESTKKKIYWADHPEEKKALETERKTLKETIDSIAENAKQKSQIFASIKTEMETKTAEEVAYEKAKGKIIGMKTELAKLGLFSGKRKRELTENIQSEEQALAPLEVAAANARKERNSAYSDQLEKARIEAESAQAEHNIARERLEAINNKLK